jgi:hypothetical protein
MSAVRELTGRRFGRLTVVQRIENHGRRSLWLCLCDCGKKTKVLGENLTSMHSTSCGCLKREIAGTVLRRHIVSGVAAIQRSNARDARLADADRDAKSRAKGGAVTAAKTAGKRKASPPSAAGTKTWASAAAALAELGRRW